MKKMLLKDEFRLMDFKWNTVKTLRATKEHGRTISRRGYKTVVDTDTCGVLTGRQRKMGRNTHPVGNVN